MIHIHVLALYEHNRQDTACILPIVLDAELRRLTSEEKGHVAARTSGRQPVRATFRFMSLPAVIQRIGVNYVHVLHFAAASSVNMTKNEDNLKKPSYTLDNKLSLMLHFSGDR